MSYHSELGLEGVVRTATRTGDTPAKERAAFKRRPPHVFLTTPESLAITLCQEAYREAFAACDTVIVDELHALLENKRGTHLAVSLERLEALLPDGVSLKRVGLSATVAPLATAAGFLVGCAPGRSCEIVEAGAGRDSVVEVLSPLGRDPYPPSGWTANRVIRDIARIVEDSRTTLVFTNTRAGYKHNFVGGAPVEIVLDGERRPFHCTAVDDPEMVATRVRALLDELGPKQGPRALGLTIDGDPTVAELTAFVAGDGVVTLDFDPA